MFYIYDNKNKNLLGEYPIIEVVNEDGTITLDVETTRASLPTNVTEVTPLKAKDGFDVLFNKDVGEWYYSDIFIKTSIKNTGYIYTLNNIDYQIPLMKDDADGLAQVNLGFMKQAFTETVIYFSNGTKLPIKADEFDDFAVWFAEKRNSFFIKEIK